MFEKKCPNVTCKIYKKMTFFENNLYFRSKNCPKSLVRARFQYSGSVYLPRGLEQTATNQKTLRETLLAINFSFFIFLV